MKYTFNWKYSSSLGGPWQAGESVELDDALAQAINIDSPGVLTPVIEGEARAVDVPPSDRMMIAPHAKRKHTVADEGVIDSTSFKAVRQKK